MDNNRYNGGQSSNGNLDDGPGPIPDRWLSCPRISSKFIENKFVAFKTPLSARYSPQMSPENHFPPEMVFSFMKMEKKKIGLWIDLTYTKRFYDRREVESRDCQYTKLKCRGHGETPSLEQTEAFIQIVDEFITNHPLEYVGVHCTHGFNRTGFLISAYLVDRMDCSVEYAIATFAEARQPGIYKQDYIDELFRRYGDEDDTVSAPERPDWCLEYDDGEGNNCDNKRKHEDDLSNTLDDAYDHNETGDGDDENAVVDNGEGSTSTDIIPKKKRRKEFLNLNATFMAGVQGVQLVTDQPRLGDLQERIQKMCKFEGRGFPGSQPVSMDMKNLQFLLEKPYRVSWKADGSRYMMLILKENEVFFFDRDNACFEVSGMRFPCMDDLNSHIFETLIDGEMVIDKVNGLSVPRYLVYDIVCLNGTSCMENEFWSENGEILSRLRCIRKSIIEPRHKAMEKLLINKTREPFSVRAKDFWGLDIAKKLLEPKFTKTLGHEPDGLIFQPSSDPYIPGQCNVVLKWKPLSMNSVDFKLKIGTESGPGILPRKIGYLFVGGLEKPFAQIKVSRQIKEYDGKIIECTFENNSWVFMRERTDKSFPNSYNTAIAVCESIKNPVTTEILEEVIEQCRYSRMMPPPPRAIPRQF